MDPEAAAREDCEAYLDFFLGLLVSSGKGNHFVFFQLRWKDRPELFCFCFGQSRIASGGQSVHDVFMTDQEIEKRLKEIKDEHKKQIEDIEKRLKEIKDEHKKQMESLKELEGDLGLVIQSTAATRDEIIANSNKGGHPNVDRATLKKYREFVDKYKITLSD